jgi:hypothetical protein
VGLRKAFRGLKATMGGRALTAVKNTIMDLNTVRTRRPPLSPALRAELADTFRNEVTLLSRQLNRDLSHWV